MKFLICSSNENENSIILNAIEGFCKKNLLKNESRIFTNSLDAAVCRDNIDIAVIDIELTDLNGITLSKILKRSSPCLKLILLSSKLDRLDDAFDLEAVRYLTKPVDTERFNEGLAEALKRIKSDSVSVDLCDGGDKVVIQKSDILVVEIKNRKTRIATNGNIYYSRLPMRFWHEKLQTANFISPHKSFIINLDGVVKYKRNSSIIMHNGENIPIARSKGQAFNLKYNEYKEAGL